MCVALVFTIIFILFTLKDKPTTAHALAVQFPGSLMNFSFEFGSALGSAEMLFPATTPRMVRAATYPSVHYLYPGLSSRVRKRSKNEADRSPHNSAEDKDA
jgi:hypothetical protein